MPDRILRVGILCNGTRFQQWQADCIRQVMSVPGAQVVVLVVNEVATEAAATAPKPFLERPWGTALYRTYRRRWFKPAAMADVDLSHELKGVPVIACRAEQRGSGQFFSEADLERIRTQRPDVLLRFGFNILRGDILELPTYGVWSYHHGDELKYRGGPPGLWEIMKGDSLIGAILQRLTDNLDAGRVLRKGWFPTVDHSLNETVDTVLTHSTPWVAQVCRALLEGDPHAADGVESATKAPLYKIGRAHV